MGAPGDSQIVAGGGSVRLLGLDVDGTIAGPDGLYSQTAALLDACATADVVVALCSARPTASLRMIAAEAPAVRYLGALQGSHVRRLGERPAVLADHVIARHRAVELIASVADAEVWWYATDAWFVLRPSPAVRAEASIVGFGPEVVDSFEGLPPANKLIVLGAGAPHPDVVGRATRLGLSWRVSQVADLEFVSADASRAKGLDVIATDLSARRGEVAAAGDGANDLEMLSYAGHGFAFPPAATLLRETHVRALAAPRAGGLETLRRWIEDR